MTAELRHLRAFVAIAQEGTLTRAAAGMHLTQPALTRTLQQLERHLGVRLVDRSTHHLELTEAGRVFLDRARAAVAAVDDALDPARVDAGPLRLGHAWSALGRHTTTVLRCWRERYPQVTLQMLRFDDGSAGLLHGAADVSVVRGRIARKGLRSERMFSEARMAAVPAGGALAGRESLTLAELSECHVVVNTRTGTTTPQLWSGHVRAPDVVPVANTDDWLAAIAGGRAIGVTTTATAQLHAHPGVAFRPLTGAPEVPVSLVWQDPPGHPAVRLLVDLVREIAAGPGCTVTAGSAPELPAR